MVHTAMTLISALTDGMLRSDGHCRNTVLHGLSEMRRSGVLKGTTSPVAFTSEHMFTLRSTLYCLFILPVKTNIPSSSWFIKVASGRFICGE